MYSRPSSFLFYNNLSVNLGFSRENFWTPFRTTFGAPFAARGLHQVFFLLCEGELLVNPNLQTAKGLGFLKYLFGLPTPWRGVLTCLSSNRSPNPTFLCRFIFDVLSLRAPMPYPVPLPSENFTVRSPPPHQSYFLPFNLPSCIPDFPPDPFSLWRLNLETATPLGVGCPISVDFLRTPVEPFSAAKMLTPLSFF